MNKHLLFPLLILGATVFVFSTCKKKKEQSCSGDPGQCQSVREAKDYFAFKLGTWWVYEEENSGARDSVYVTESSIDSDGYQFNIRTYSTYQEYYYHYWSNYVGGTGIPSCNETDPVDKKCLFVEYTKYKPGEDYLGQSQCFFVNYRKGFYETTGGSVVGEVFNKTVKIHELCSEKEGRQPINNFYSKGVGIIKKELLDSNQVWNLVNYHIEP